MKRGELHRSERGERVGAELKRVLMRLLHGTAKDPRLGDITIHEVRVSRDLSHARVYFTCFPPDGDCSGQAGLLNGPLARFLRGALAQSLRLRTVPQLHFVHDDSIVRGEQLAMLIERAVDADRERTARDPDN